MVVTELNIVGVTIDETKADAPLIVDGNRVLACAIGFQRVKPIARRHSQVRQLRSDVNQFELPECAPRHVGRHSLRGSGHEQLFGPPVREGLDHIEL